VISLYVLMKLKWFYCSERLVFLEKINELSSGNFPQVILTNIEIPEMDGIQTVQQHRLCTRTGL
jgi:CheY-like chemotaxis protein